jgi:hypothetical protein
MFVVYMGYTYSQLLTDGSTFQTVSTYHPITHVRALKYTTIKSFKRFLPEICHLKERTDKYVIMDCGVLEIGGEQYKADRKGVKGNEKGH